MATTTSGVSKVGSNYYKTSVTSNANGSLSSTTYRTDSKGNNPVEVSSVSNASSTSSGTRTFAAGATESEKAAFSNPQSAERQAYSSQVQSLNPANATAEQKQSYDKLTGGSGNSAATNQETNTSGAASSAQAEESGANAQTSVERGTEPDQGKTLVYPRSRKNGNGGDFIHIEMRTYQKSGFQSASDSFTITRMEDRLYTRIADVYLPIQSGIVDSISVDWGNGELDPLTAQFANVAMGTMAEAAKGDLGAAVGEFAGGIKDIATKVLKDGNSDMQKLAINYFTQQAVSTPGLIGRSIGGAINNNLELLFNGPTLRSFTFNFKLTPREKDEANDIKEIIRLFKRGMSPALSKSGLFLAAPNVFKIKYIYTGNGSKSDPHPYLNRIKVAALRDFSVNYTPDGNYMTYGADGSMTQYDLSMTFGEIDPVYAQDYEDEQGSTGMGW